MKVTISLDFDDSMKEEIMNEFLYQMGKLDYTEEQLNALEKSFIENISNDFKDATFEIEMNADDTEVTGCILVGG